MQEFAFTVTYERGADELMDVFIDQSGLYSRTVSCQATTDTMWRVDEVTGPREALAAYDRRLEKLERCTNLQGMGGCRLDLTYEVLAREPTSRHIYSRQSEGDGCRSIPYLVAGHLGDGVLCRAEQYGNEYRWRLLADDEASLSSIYDALEEHLREGLTLEFERLEQSPTWQTGRVSGVNLPYAQREALELAVEYGYYETPRQCSLQEIADAEGIPISTLQYRVTRAEAWLATTFLSNEPPDREESTGIAGDE
ncbi:helix-turn-helix domain-containing protein [Natrinema versiforme]|uniref:Bacterio-opsin activator HTH domain-containing protein n=1 Tax=Natrinema versiforme JCM 10478 TaxID=1227496 RepID=L9XR57_9EURY|nr:helix-turn-helix domain-containing protein [Natrinema versiforme]ELY63088.1 bacterio-opsin activator HTH domain-containing protein [Natrinema versiforme JCM 10478]